MKDLSWVYQGGSPSKFSTVGPADMYNEAAAKMDLLCKRYTSATSATTTQSDKCIYRAAGYIGLFDSSYSDLASFRASLSDDDVIYYQLAVPIVTELDEADQNFRDYYNVADFGTEQSQSSVPSAAFSADIIYQFNAVDMIREHELEINELQSIIATMQAQLTSLINK